MKDFVKVAWGFPCGLSLLITDWQHFEPVVASEHTSKSHSELNLGKSMMQSFAHFPGSVTDSQRWEKFSRARLELAQLKNES